MQTEFPLFPPFLPQGASLPASAGWERSSLGERSLGKAPYSQPPQQSSRKITPSLRSWEGEVGRFRFSCKRSLGERTSGGGKLAETSLLPKDHSQPPQLGVIFRELSSPLPTAYPPLLPQGASREMGTPPSQKKIPLNRLRKKSMALQLNKTSPFLGGVKPSPFFQQRRVSNSRSGLSVEEIGRVLSIGGGIARVYGLNEIRTGEMVEFVSGVKGMALNLKGDNVVVLLFGSGTGINEGDVVKRAGTLIRLPVCSSLLPV